MTVVASEVLGTEQPKRKEILFGVECEVATVKKNKAYNRILQEEEPEIPLKDTVLKGG
jgi:hypothetical protein